ncbi:hypothetical protein THAOC_07384, partial [Thalassiosira oceanica]
MPAPSSASKKIVVGRRNGNPACECNQNEYQDNKTDYDTVGGNGQVKLTTKTKTLVTTQLASVKSDHYTTYLGPSWRRLAEGRKSTEEESVQPDFFIACVDEACNQLEDEGYCHKLD